MDFAKRGLRGAQRSSGIDVETKHQVGATKQASPKHMWSEHEAKVGETEEAGASAGFYQIKRGPMGKPS